MKATTTKQQILLVEDSPADIFLIREALAAQHLDVELTCMNDIPEAIEKLADESLPLPDAILVDLNLPSGEGLSLVRHVRGSGRLERVPIAIITSSQSPNDRRQAVELQVDRYIAKPTHLDDFLDSVGTAVAAMLKGV
jgi:CheY-like chemotaxis protein